MADQDEDFSSLPLQDRFAHKNWKVRKEAYEAAAKEFNSAQTEADPVVRDFQQDPGLWKAAVSDSNVAAHQEALVALCSFLQVSGTQGCTRTRSLAVSSLVEKGLTSTKATTKQKAMEAILLYVELDKPDPVIEELLPILSNKLPKIVAATLSAFTAICHEFGCKTVDPKPIVKVLPKAFGHADKNVRAEASNLTTELYRWLREAMKPLFWNDLKPVQQQDLEKLFEKVKDEPPPKPERLLKSQQAAAAAAPAVSAEAAGGEGELDEDDAVDLEPEFMAVDVMAKIPKDLEERLASTKWKDRKDALDDLHTVINVPAMEEANFNDIMHSLAKCMKDANIMVVTAAANCVELFAKGLRRSFGKYRVIVMKPLIERLKERKQTVTDALGAALDAVCASTSLSDCLEDILEALKDKNPLVKLETTRVLVRALKTARDAPSIQEVNLIAETAKKLLADAQEVQRTAAVEVLGVLLKIMGERIMNSHLEGLDEIRKGKIKECSEAVEVRAKYKPKPVAPPPKAAAPAPTGQKRPGPGVKKPLGAGSAAIKKPATIDDDSGFAPLQPKPTARSATSRPGAAPPAGVRSLKPPASGISGKKPAAVASPQRLQRPQTPDEVPSPARNMPRGLTGRHLSKPSSASTEPAPTPTQPTTSALSSAERIELEDLRADAERLRSTNDSLKSDNARLTSQIRELQDQNTHLIEDHTRDVLSIKAKETQLVRARSDAESSEQAAAQLQQEVERLKRELTRLDRHEAAQATEDSYDPNSRPEVFQVSDQRLNGVGAAPGTRARRALVSPTSAGGKENEQEGFRTSGNSDIGDNHGTAVQTDKLMNKSRLLSSSRAAGIPRATSTAYASPMRPASSISARMQNGPLSPPPPVPSMSTSAGLEDDDYVQVDGSESAPPPSHDDDQQFDEPAAKTPLASRMPQYQSGISRAIPRGSGTNGAGSVRGTTGVSGSSTGQESWRRAAEVTQNLKARIELMKQRQGMSR